LAFAAPGSGVAAAPPIDLNTKVLFFFFGANDVAIGTVKWFNPTKGYGFIAPDGGGNDVFVHISAVEKAGYTSLVEGAKVSYELVTNRSGKQAAENLRLG
jgi:CspA family cold shock protein